MYAANAHVYIGRSLAAYARVHNDHLRQRGSNVIAEVLAEAGETASHQAFSLLSYHEVPAPAVYALVGENQSNEAVTFVLALLEARALAILYDGSGGAVSIANRTKAAFANGIRALTAEDRRRGGRLKTLCLPRTSPLPPARTSHTPICSPFSVAGKKGGARLAQHQPAWLSLGR